MNWRTVSYLILFALVFLDPFFFNIPLGPLRITAIRVVIGILVMVMLYRFIIENDQIIKRPIYYPVLFLFGWFIYGVISVSWATDKDTGIKEIYYFSTFILFIMLMIYLLQSKRQFDWMKLSFWLIGIVTIMICGVELVTNLHLPTSRYVQEAVRFGKLSQRVATAFFYNENDLALFLVILAPFFLVGLLGARWYIKIINIVCIALIFVIMSFNAARLAFISVLIQLVFFLYLAKKEWFYRGVRSSIFLSPIILGLCWYFLKDNFDTLFDVSGLEKGYGSGFIRLNLYLNGVYSMFQSFMLGVGPGNYGMHIYPIFNTKGIVNPHNWWIEILTNYGFIVFIGYLAFYWYFLKKTYLIFKNDTKNNLLALTLFLSFIGFSLACIGPSRLFYFWPMWLLFGVSLAYIKTKMTEIDSIEGDLS